ncbi:SH3 and multiple ankyrin repeat domains protein 1-like [Orussus abietinus]|uniref:SH3 and multiple ankyrin repeat domains protein 1-like n=1 Tax=Orussus abietinus TaxID=222816 RepID=UPI000C715B85|nr:SH3 and multiple ankyrin repeat domains protein 1-like [Orussus abietinus]
MPTDDDYGRSSRLLSQQHPSGQYVGSSGVGLVSGAVCAQGVSCAQSSPPPGGSGDHLENYGVRYEKPEKVDPHHHHHYPHHRREEDFAARVSHQYSSRVGGQSQGGGLSERYSRYQELGCPEQYQGGDGQGVASAASASDHRRHGSQEAQEEDYGGSKKHLPVADQSRGNPFGETFPSPPSPAPAGDRFVPPPPLSPPPGEKYSSSGTLAGYAAPDRLLAAGSPVPRYPGGPGASKERGPPDRVLAPATSSPAHGDQRYGGGGANGSPVLQQDRSGYCLPGGAGKEVAPPDRSDRRYPGQSGGELGLSPHHAALLPERYAAVKGAAVADRYHRQEVAPAATATVAAQRHERYLSASPNPEGAHHQRYQGSTASSSSSTCSAEQSALQQRRYSASGPEHSSPGPGDLAARFLGFQEVAQATHRYLGTDRFAEQHTPRYGSAQARERYLVAASLPGADRPPGGQGPPDGRYSCSSTERLLASASPSSDAGRFYGAFVGSGLPGAERYGLSPTSEGGLRYGPKSSDKYLPLGKSLQAYAERYQGGPDPFQGALERYQPGPPDRYLAPADPLRYSPARGAQGPDKYLGPLAKPKDRFPPAGPPPTGRIANPPAPASVPASYVPPNAHTPVERYVPQPPPEVLYPERYAERYVPPAAHTPTDRYVPAADPGDPYMRRDLGFHHHYRLPPPGYPYHQGHFRFRGLAYAPPGRLGGSPGSSSSGSSTSNQRELSTSPLLRSKNRNQVEFQPRQGPANPAPCCSQDVPLPGQRTCCPTLRRSLPPGALPAIPTQTTHSSWQPSPGSATTGTTSTSSSTGPEGEATQGMGTFAVGGVSVATSTEGPGTTPATSSPPSVPSTRVGAPGPRPPRPGSATPQRPRTRRTLSRTEALKR